MPFVIAEAGVNHNGDIALALDLVDRAAAAGADAVKFQTFSADDIVSPGAPTASYQQRNTAETNQHAMLRALELPREAWARIAARCTDRAIEFMSTPFDPAALGMLVDLGLRRVKIPSGEIVNAPLLRAAAGTGLPIVLSTGMATIDEVRDALALLRAAGAADVTVLHCTSDYPAPMADVHLRAMVSMGESLHVPVGYSDHTMGDHVAVAATALGAVVIEKHFTLSRDLPGPDHKASLEPDELAAMVRRVRDIAVALGNETKQPSPAERETAKLVRRSWHAARPIAAGTTIQDRDVVLRRPASGMLPTDSPVGRIARDAISENSPIRSDGLA